MISVIVPAYNEKNSLPACLSSLKKQSYSDLEIIVVDDGSTDGSVSNLNESEIKILKQEHKGPGTARNLGASYASGEILVFVDADMTFDKNFIKNLTLPIIQKKLKGTFTKDEYVSNWDNIWAKCWNWNEGLNNHRRIPENFPDFSPVFRAILKTEFKKVNGFDDIGFTDDWSLSRKLGYKARKAINAVCFHKNPDTLKEVFRQARWIGKNEFIAGNLIRKIRSLLKFNPATQFIRGTIISIQHKNFYYLIFSIVYYSGVTISVLLSFFGEKKSK